METSVRRNMPNRQWLAWSGLALVGIILLRLALLGQLALTDNTEARYGSIGWRMFHTGDWVTPRLHVNGQLVPFWGKPPLQFWLTSLSYKSFGVSEWSARIPSFLLGIAIVAATIFFAYTVWGKRVAALAGIVLSSSVLFFLLSGACVTDVPLTASVSAAMIAFVRFAENSTHRKAWGLGFFLALAVGALAKGPIALVLVAVAIGIWLTLVRRWKLVSELPWLSGIVVFVVVAVPWYQLAERASPGFLRYFLINENFLRYVSNDYGDLYGFGRKRPYGTIWPMLVGSFLPWTVLAVVALLKVFRKPKLGKVVRDDQWLTYALVWGLTPPLFFTFARQIVLTYLLPGFPGLAVATAVGLDRWMESDAEPGLIRWLKAHFVAVGLVALTAAVVATVRGVSLSLVAVVVSAVVLGWIAWAITRRWGTTALVGTLGLATTLTLSAMVVLMAPWIDEQYSAKTVLTHLYENSAARSRPIVMPFGEPCSAVFYVNAIFQGRFEHHPPQKSVLVQDVLAARGRQILLFKRDDWDHLEPELAARLVPITQTAHWVACEAWYNVATVP